MTRHANCPWCADNGPHVVRGRRPAQLLTDTIIIRLDCRMCSSAFEIQETPASAVAKPPIPPRAARPAAEAGLPT